MAIKGDKFLAQSIIPGVQSQEIIFRGIQEGFDEIPSIAIYDLTKDIEGHGTGSTVSRTTLDEAGFVLPENAP